jgi:intein/homing endonuclease
MEMNMHLPQNLLAETELRHLAAIPYQLISPRSNSPIIGIFQDSMLGSFLYTREKLLFEPRFAMNLLMMFPDVNVQELQESMKRNGGKISNFDILSQILPPFSIEYKTDLFDKDKEKAETSNNILEIRNGKYVRGQIIKSVINGGSKGIIHRINNDFGNETATKFIDNYQNIITEYMKSHAYSVGVSDLIANQQTYTEIAKQIDIKKNEVQDIISEVHLGIFKNITANSSIVEFESRIHNLLNKAREATSEIAKKSLNKSNRFVQIVTSGSKGSVVNITQMIACLGQQDVDGKRIPYGFDSRTLPHFSKFDDGANARGFIENSYISGLTSQELFFHAMAGRIGLIDTAVKSVTWETPIVIIEKGQSKYTEIGKWIDGQLDTAIPENVQHFKERNMELMNLPNDQVYIPTTDEDGKVTWGEVTAITRHDPGEVLYEIKTSGGRKVIVTESKSLLIWNAETKKLVETLTPEILVGDCVPVTGELCESPILLDSFIYNDEKIESKTYDDGILFGNKFDSDIIPNELFIARKSFVWGFLFAYGLSQSKRRVTSYRFAEGTAMLYSRLGTYLNIEQFGEEWMAVPDMDNKLKKYNNIVLDTIIEINLVDVKDHPKVYDLTIPTTLNFGLANGLQVRDTSTTGYIQRRLIKGLEDLKVEYDMTVRNSIGKIVQFRYGGDGFDSTKVEGQNIGLVSQTISDIYSHYQILGVNIEKGDLDQVDEAKLESNLLSVYSKGAVSRCKKQVDEAKKRCKEIIDMMITARNDLVVKVFKNKNENKINTPIGFAYLISNIQGQLDLNDNHVVDITPLEAFQLMDEYFEKIKKMVYSPPTELFKIMYYYYLSPKDILIKKRFHKKALTLLLETILLKYKQAIVHPGEMVGIVAGQSLGEPTTQLSVAKTTRHKVIKQNKITKEFSLESIEVGPFCDAIIEKYPNWTFNTGHKDSVETLLEPLEDEYFIVGVDKEEKTHWNKISHISRHIVNGNMMRVTTKSGRKVETTTSHSHLVRRNQTIEPIVGANMKVGMRIPVAKHIDNPFIQKTFTIGKQTFELDYLWGWFFGAYLAEGNLSRNSQKNGASGGICITNISPIYIENTKKIASLFGKEGKIREKEGPILGSEKNYKTIDTLFSYKPLADFIYKTCGTGSFVKVVPDFAFIAPDEFKAGLLCGYMDGDGNFQNDDKHHQIRVCSRSEQLIKDISLLFNYFGIFGSLKTNYRNGANYYNLAMSARYSKLYQKHIGTELHKEKLQDLVDYYERDNVHNLSDDIDRIEGLGHIIAKCGLALKFLGQSRNYGRWAKKEDAGIPIGRRTLQKYIETFESHPESKTIEQELRILKQASNSDAIWDEIVNIEIYTPEQTEYVYDFTIPANQTFMTDYGIIVHNTLNKFC